MLTPKQKELLTYLAQSIDAEGVAPSYDEMKDALELKSKSGIHRMVLALEERGFIRRLPNRARAIEILRLPPDLQAAAEAAHAADAPGFTPRVIEGGRGDDAVEESGAAPPAETVPLYGRIAAGTPIEAISDLDRMIEVPHGLMGHGEHYALEVDGDSMIEAGILDGDTVLIRRADTADDGSIVVALVDGEEATLKTLHRAGPHILLEPANAAHRTQKLEADRVVIQGQLVALFRRY